MFLFCSIGVKRAATPEETVNLPLETLDLDGRIVVRMSGLPDLPVGLRLEGRPRTGSSWVGRLEADGPGFHLTGSGALLRAGQELEFQVQAAELDIAVWSAHLQRLDWLYGFDTAPEVRTAVPARA